MLQTNVVSPETLELIRKLMQDDYLSDFFLVGGTSIAFYLGHRISIDIDLFTQKEFNAINMFYYLHNKYNFMRTYSHPNTLKGTIGHAVVDLITYSYKSYLSTKFPLKSMLDFYVQKFHEDSIFTLRALSYLMILTLKANRCSSYPKNLNGRLFASGLLI